MKILVAPNLGYQEYYYYEYVFYVIFNVHFCVLYKGRIVWMYGMGRLALVLIAKQSSKVIVLIYIHIRKSLRVQIEFFALFFSLLDIFPFSFFCLGICLMPQKYFAQLLEFFFQNVSLHHYNLSSLRTSSMDGL